jgi:hypothetical protein
MPNWCNNFIQIRHKDPAMIERVLKGKDGLFMEFFPTPEPLTETVVGYPGEDKQAAQAAQQAANLEQFGYKDWYDWNVANWGTKWDIELGGIERMDDNSISAFFDSAWSPPIGAYAQLVEMGFDIDAMYYEPGMAFCGRWINGLDDFWNLSDMTAETVSSLIDSDVDEQFAISENMAQWEEEARADEESNQ